MQQKEAYCQWGGEISGLIPIISPDDKIMELFNETISIVFKKIICLQKECKTLQGLRDTLLPQLISGKIRVNQPEDAAA
ncbi:hypothetical protein [Thiolapillus sp.]